MASVAALGIWLVGAGAASAASPEYLIEGNPVPGQEKILEKTDIGDDVMLAEPLGIKTEILCEEGTTLTGSWLGEIKKGWDHGAFSACVVNKPSGCKVKQPIELSGNGELVGSLPNPKLLITPATGSIFVELTLESCLLAGKYRVEGSQECTLPEATIEKVTHEIRCSEIESKLTIGGLPAGFEGFLVGQLESGKAGDIS